MEFNMTNIHFFSTLRNKYIMVEIFRERLFNVLITNRGYWNVSRVSTETKLTYCFYQHSIYKVEIL